MDSKGEIERGGRGRREETSDRVEVGGGRGGRRTEGKVGRWGNSKRKWGDTVCSKHTDPTHSSACTHKCIRTKPCGHSARNTVFVPSLVRDFEWTERGTRGKGEGEKGGWEERREVGDWKMKRREQGSGK